MEILRREIHEVRTMVAADVRALVAEVQRHRQESSLEDTEEQ
jgi:hypothetical protein